MADTENLGQSAHEGLIDGLARCQVPGEGVTLDVLVGGAGPPLLLLHGYRQTRMTWHAIVPRLKEHFTLVVPDLRGYGRSDKPAGDAAHLNYSKRVMALDQLRTMKFLGFDRFNVAGHDRGGRVAYRLALDHPDAIERIAVIDIVPTSTVFSAGAATLMSLFHWSFLSQPFPVPEKILEGRTDEFLLGLFDRWVGPGFKFNTSCMEDYLRSARQPDCLHAGCADYRAAWHVDRVHDEEALLRKMKISAPLRVLWGEVGSASQASPIDFWVPWADVVSGRSFKAGHFLPEEVPDALAADLLQFFSETQ